MLWLVLQPRFAAVNRYSTKPIRFLLAMSGALVYADSGTLEQTMSALRGAKHQSKEARREAVITDLKAGFPVETVAETFGMRVGWVYALAKAHGVPVEVRLCGHRLRGYLSESRVRAGGVVQALEGSDESFMRWLIHSTEPGETLAETLVGTARELYEKEMNQ